MEAHHAQAVQQDSSWLLAIAAAAGMSGDPFAPEKDLDGPRRQPRLDLGAQETMRDAVILEGDLDMIVDADAALLRFRVLVRLCRQPLQRRTIDLFQQAPARHAQRADRRRIFEKTLSPTLRPAMSSPIAALTSARLWKIRWRSRPMSQRSTINTRLFNL